MRRGLRRTRFTAARSSRRRCGIWSQQTWRSSTPCSCAQNPSSGFRSGASAGRRSRCIRCTAPLAKNSFQNMTAMPGGAIPNHHHAVGPFPQQVFQKGHDVGSMEGTLLAVKIHLARRGNGRDRRHMVACPPLSQHGRLPHGRIGTHDTGQGIKAGLVSEEDRLVLGFGPLLMAGQVSSRQRAIAASSRWRTRRSRFCGLQRMALQRRPTWDT